MPSKERVSIAVIGLGCRFPGKANSPEAFWSLLSEGRDGWTQVPADRFNEAAFHHPDPNFPGAIAQTGGHFLDQDVAAFDAGFFGIPPMEAESMDPQHRLGLEVSYEAAENAGVSLEQLNGSDTAVFVAGFSHDYEYSLLKDPDDLGKYYRIGTKQTMLANRISYTFNLKGPSVVLDTACSGSMVAVHLACQTLRNGETTMALAGGVGLIISPDQMAATSIGQFLNKDGRCFAFDSKGNGYGRAEGVGIVALKRLDDALQDGDNIRAIIRGSGVNQDGRTNGITLPNQHSQESLARKVFENLPFGPSSVHYVEAHGTGTRAGDLAEMNALKNVFCESREAEKPLIVGAVKANIGHSEAASGSAGLIKTILALEKGLIPPNILLEKLKPGLEPQIWGIKLPGSLELWPEDETRKAVVNSFGFGGTNAMVVLESSNAFASTAATTNGKKDISSEIRSTVNGAYYPNETPRLFTLSARSEFSLTYGIEDLMEYLRLHRNVNLSDLSHTSVSRRSNLPWRCGVVAGNVESLIQKLKARRSTPAKAHSQTSIVFVFTGQGAQWARMGHDLLQGDNEFSRSVHRAEGILEELGASWSLTIELSKEVDETRLNDSKFGQISSTAIQLALVDMLNSWGIKPVAVVGHSSGEIAAAYAAGAITHATAIRIAYYRGFVTDEAKRRTTKSGAMLAVGLSEEDAQSHIEKLGLPDLVIACVNSPSSTTLSGTSSSIVAVKSILDQDGVFARQLKVDVAYHSAHMQTVADDYSARLQGIESGATSPAIRFFSSVTGVEKKSGFGAEYWVDNLISQVHFSGALQLLCHSIGRQMHLTVVEIGPHNALAGPIRQCLASMHIESLSFDYTPTLIRGNTGITSLLEAEAALFEAGGKLDTDRVASIGICGPTPNVIGDLPPYHWDRRKTYWREPRLSKAHRKRRYPYHDLLGLRVLTSPDDEPSWRMILSLDRLPWLQDHMVDKVIVFPGTGYIAMAIEALRQVHSNAGSSVVVKGYRLTNVSFVKMLALPDDSSNREVILNMQRLSPEDYHFRIYSVSDQEKWQEHCQGQISAEVETATDGVNHNHETEAVQRADLSSFALANEECVNYDGVASIYEKMRSAGNDYGLTFARMVEFRTGNQRALAIHTIPNIEATMPAQFIQPHLIHPTIFDSVLHTAIPLFQEHCGRDSVIPVRLDDVYVSADITDRPGDEIQAVCALQNMTARSVTTDIIAFQRTSSGDLKKVLSVVGGEMRAIGTSKPSPLAHNSDAAFKLQWGYDISSITTDTLTANLPMAQSAEDKMSLAERLTILQSACTRYFQWSMRDINEQQLTVCDDHRARFFSWLTEFCNFESRQSLLNKSSSSKELLARQLDQLGVEGELVKRIGANLTAILIGETDPVALFAEDNLIHRMDEGELAGICNEQQARYVKHLAFQSPGLKILELGTTSGESTLALFNLLSPNGERFLSEYVLLDRSPQILEAGRSRLPRWEQMITFKELRTDRGLSEQGFPGNYFDIILANHALHTASKPGELLNGIHKLLKPDGKLAFIGPLEKTPYHQMMFGLIHGGWDVHAACDCGSLSNIDSDLEDRRKPDPSSHLEELLHSTSFSGLDLIAHSVPESEHCSALIVSTALYQSTTNRHHSTRAKIIHAFLKSHMGSQFCEDLSRKLVSKGFEVSHCGWLNHKIDTSSSYILIDSTSNLLLANASPDQFAFIKLLMRDCSKVYWLTITEDLSTIAPDLGIVRGFARSIRNEFNHLKFFTIDVQDRIDHHESRATEDIIRLVLGLEKKLCEGLPTELEYMYRDGKFHIQRFVADSKLNKAIVKDPEDPGGEVRLFHQAKRRLKLHLNDPGLLSSISFVDNESTLKPLDAGEVEIQVYAHGVNFKDVIIALGQMNPSQVMVGEGAGVVTKVGSNFATEYCVGDRVALLFGTPYASRSRTHGHLVHKIADALSFTDAASIPLAYATAYHGLVDTANLSKGQSVLIHAASGGLGQAAISIAQYIGATIFATVGSKEKQQFLMDKYGIPQDHIFSSRNTEFKSGILQLTGGEGADVALNSLSGKLLQCTLECVARFGTFVEVGKSDIYKRTGMSLDSGPFDKSIKFASVDMALLARWRPSHAQRLLQRIFSHVERGEFMPLPVTTMPISKVEEAFRLLQARKHMGKVVLRSDADSQVKVSTRQPLRLHPNATYVVIGGLGSLGKHVCRHLQANGARHVVLITKRQLDQVTRSARETELSVFGACVRIVSCDITEAHQVSNVARDLEVSFPPVKGIIHGAMVLRDRLFSQMTLTEFREALDPKYQGTRNLVESFDSSTLDFFITLSSIAAVVGLQGQANYAAGNTYQDMLAHSKAFSGLTNFVSLNLPLIEETEATTQDIRNHYHRQGGETMSIKQVLPLLDYAMSGQASRDDCNQIVFGLTPKSLLERSKNRLEIPPLLSHVPGMVHRMEQAQSTAEPTIANMVASSADPVEVDRLIAEATRAKISQLVAVNEQEVSLDAPLVDLGLDSLVAVELKNWITKSLQASIQIPEILDSPGLTSLAAKIRQSLNLVKQKEMNGSHNTNLVGEAKQGVRPFDSAALPKMPLQSLDETIERYSAAIEIFGGHNEREGLRKALAEFLLPDGIGRRVQERLVKRANDPDVENWMTSAHNKSAWLKRRDLGPRGGHFFGTHALSKNSQSQAERASLITLATFEHKLAIDAGNIEREYLEEEPLEMESLQWLLATNRTPMEGCDRVDYYPKSEHIVAMRDGHVYKIPLKWSGTTLTRAQLEAVFQAILDQPSREASGLCYLTSTNRDVWARKRDEVLAVNLANKELISAIESSIFVVCLDNSSPVNAAERGACFLLDDSSNRWLDKTTELIVCANGVSATWCEHAMIDGATFDQLNATIAAATVEHQESTSSDESTAISLPSDSFTEYPFTSTPELDACIAQARSDHLSIVGGRQFHVYEHTQWSITFLRHRKLLPKTVFQLMIQVAARLHYGYSPPSWDIITLRQFRKGRNDILQVQTPAVEAFCAAATSPDLDTIPLAERRRLFAEAAKSHAREVAVTRRGRGWYRHLVALQDMLEPGEEEPALYSDPLYLKIRPRKVFTTFVEANVPEGGATWKTRDSIWLSCQVSEESFRAAVVCGEERAEEFVGHLETAAERMKRIIDAL